MPRPGTAHFDRIEGLDFIDRVIEIDQSPIGRTPRSNPATYTGLFAPIREIFAAVPESRARGYEAGRFSFNVKGGRCEACQGDGVIKVEMHFLADVYVPCDVCKGKRYNRETLEIRYKGKNIQEVLELTVEDALPFFSAVPTVQPKLQTLLDVGLSYVRLGQSATTLSGGEAQRVKLAKELSKRATGRTLYILDEPTTGLHFADIEQLLGVLQRLRDEGNTVIVIEHNLDVIKTADWVVDLGPEGGDGGGGSSRSARRNKLRRTRPPTPGTICGRRWRSHRCANAHEQAGRRWKTALRSVPLAARLVGALGGAVYWLGAHSGRPALPWSYRCSRPHCLRASPGRDAEVAHRPWASMGLVFACCSSTTR